MVLDSSVIKLNKYIKECDYFTNMIGVYDVLSAKIASKKSRLLFLSGYAFSSAYYGLPDEGFINQSDIIDLVSRIKSVLPNSFLIVDIDDGYSDPKIASYYAKRLHLSGADGVILEDQQRPKKCGHLNGKSLRPIEEYLEVLRAVRQHNPNLFVIARTDESDIQMAVKRLDVYQKEKPNALLADGLKSHESITLLKNRFPNELLVVNLIEGGKTPNISFSKAKSIGVNILNYSTPLIFAAYKSQVEYLEKLVTNDGLFPGDNDSQFELLNEEVKRDS